MSTPSFPAHWAVGSFRHFADFTTGWTPPTEDAEAYEGPHPWANISDLGPAWISETRKHLSDREVHGAVPCNVGDLLFAFKLSVGTVSRAARAMFTNEAIATISASRWLDPAYGFYALPEFLPRAANTNIYGALLLNTGLIRRAQVALPPVHEQRQIAEFLDRETARIDTLIEEQERLIELLRERRRAVISHAVLAASETRVPLRRLVDVIDCAHVTAEFVDDHRYPVASIRECQGAAVDLKDCNFTTEPFFRLLRESGRAPRVGDLLFVRNVSVGLVAAVMPGTPEFAVGQETVLLRNKSGTNPAFLRYALEAGEVVAEIERAMIGSTFRRINVSAIRSLPVPAADFANQVETVALLDEQTANIDELITEAERFIALASERRAALITAAVTGQIDVRDPEPLEVG